MSLDTALRTMLAERAQDITELPDTFADLAARAASREHDASPDHDVSPEPEPEHDVLELGGHRMPGRENVRHLRRSHGAHHPGRRTTWLVAASVAALLAAGGVVVAIGLDGGHDKQGNPSVRTGSHTPSPTPSHSTSQTQPRPTARIRSTCKATEPGSWRSAFADGSLDGANTAMPLAFSGKNLVVTRDFGTYRDVALVAPDGKATSVYKVPDPDQNQVLTAAAEGGYLVVPVSRFPRGANGIIPSIVRLELVDLRTGSTTTITTAPFTTSHGTQGRTVEAATIFRGKVYYNDIPTYVSPTTTIHAYDIARGTTAVVGTHSAMHQDGPLVRAGGLYWSQDDTTPAIATMLPKAVQNALTTGAERQNLTSDGTSYAWSASRDQIGYWTPGMAEPSIFTVGGGAVMPDVVAGRVVMYEDPASNNVDTGLVLDTRSSARTSIAGLATVQPNLLAGAGTLVVGGFAEESTPITTITAASLPKLHC